MPGVPRTADSDIILFHVSVLIFANEFAVSFLAADVNDISAFSWFPFIPAEACTAFVPIDVFVSFIKFSCSHYALSASCLHCSTGCAGCLAQRWCSAIFDLYKYISEWPG